LDKSRNSAFVRNRSPGGVPKQERKRIKEEFLIWSEIVPLENYFFGPKTDNRGIPFFVRNRSPQEFRDRYKNGQCSRAK
jgi:hypothetical protein